MHSHRVRICEHWDRLPIDCDEMHEHFHWLSIKLSLKPEVSHMLIFTKCCHYLLGCESCVDECCPRCQAPRGFAETCRVNEVPVQFLAMMMRAQSDMTRKQSILINSLVLLAAKWYLCVYMEILHSTIAFPLKHFRSASFL